MPSLARPLKLGLRIKPCRWLAVDEGNPYIRHQTAVMKYEPSHGGAASSVMSRPTPTCASWRHTPWVMPEAFRMTDRSGRLSLTLTCGPVRAQSRAQANQAAPPPMTSIFWFVVHKWFCHVLRSAFNGTCRNMTCKLYRALCCIAGAPKAEAHSVATIHEARDHGKSRHNVIFIAFVGFCRSNVQERLALIAGSGRKQV